MDNFWLGLMGGCGLFYMLIGVIVAISGAIQFYRKHGEDVSKLLLCIVTTLVVFSWPFFVLNDLDE